MFEQYFDREHYLTNLPSAAGFRSVNIDVEIMDTILQNSDKIQRTEI